MKPGPLPAVTGGELKERMDAERRGLPFLVSRDQGGDQVLTELSSSRLPLTVGRTAESDLRLDFDPEVSRLHAQLERAAGEWIVVDDGLSSNGTFVNGERVVGRRRLRDGDALRFGNTVALFRAPGDDAGGETIKSADAVLAADVTETQKRVLLALSRPFLEGSSMAAPATNQEIADAVFLSVDAVKAHLKALFVRFEIADLPQNQKRIRLAELAIRSGVVALRDLDG